MHAQELEGLQTEARRLGRYLAGREPGPELTARYAQAVASRDLLTCDEVDRRLLAVTARHRWTIGPLDAACALLRPRAALRVRLLVLAAVLETSTSFTDCFLPPRRVVPGSLVRVGLFGIRALGRLALGLPLYLITTSGRFPIRTGA